MYGERGGTIDLPTPKRAANGYPGQLPAPRPSGGWEASALDLKGEPELPALFDDLELGDALDAALPTLDGEGDEAGPGAGTSSRPSILGLDLRDLPAPVGPLPRSPLSTSPRVLAERRAAASVPAVAVPAVVVAARGPAAKPLAPADTEPAPLPAPPARGQSGELRQFVPGGAVPPGIADGKLAARPGSPLSRPPLVEGPVPPLPGKRVSAPGIVVPSFRDLAAREAVPRRTSQPGIPLLSKPVHGLFDASDAAPPGPPPRAAEPTPVPLPPLPSDESGNPQATPLTTAASGSASGSEGSETSVLSGQPAGSSVVTVEPRPVRLGYLIAGLAVLALLLALVIGYIAGLWPSPKAPGPSGAKPALSSGSPPESPPPSF